MCLTCDIVAGKGAPAGGVIYKDEFVVVHHCVDVAVAGYLIVSPLRHAEGFGDLTDGEIARLGAAAKKAVNALKEVEGVERVYIAGFGEVTAHFHLHIFPRYRWMPLRLPEATDSCGRLDGPRLLSICRAKYRAAPEAMNRPEIVAMAEFLRGRMGE
jgi:diadenosine tetraphosphate (Ap4A) HIT family hydrolase